MAKITFMGAGSAVFAKNILGDSMLAEPLQDAHIALYDIDFQRLRDSKMMLENLNEHINKGRARITAHHGERARRAALRGADYVINAIQVGGYEPSTVIDFEIPKKYGLRQTIADTLGIGGIYRTLRTLPVLWDFAADMEKECPDALFINYSNPMSMLVIGWAAKTDIPVVGLCHSVQGCVPGLLRKLDMDIDPAETQWRIAGINHQAWLLEVTHHGKDLYPEIKKRAAKKNREARKSSGEKHGDMVRFEMMRRFGYYITESSEHAAEYMPFWIKSAYPELIEEFNIPLDEYPRRCVNQIKNWEKRREELIGETKLEHKRSHEYGSYIMEAMETGNATRIHGNVMNDARLIPNLPDDCSVEVPCLIDRNGVQPIHFGRLPEQCAAMNRTNINVQTMTVQAALTGRKDHVYQAAMLDPHTAAELSVDDIVSMCDELFEAHGEMMPKFK